MHAAFELLENEYIEGEETYSMLCVAVCGWKEFDVVIGTVLRDQYC